MITRETINEKLEELANAIGSDESLVENIMSRIDAQSIANSNTVRKFNNLLISRRFLMNPVTKFSAAAAVVLIAVLLSMTALDKLIPAAYAIDQTLEALENVRFIHIASRDDTGKIKDERWIEIGPDGFQIRYRQDTPPNFLVVEDGQTVSVYYKDKNAVILYDPKDKQYQWVGNLREWLDELVGQGSVVIEENVDYRGRNAHRVRCFKSNTDCYVDPETKLPIAIGGYQISYEYPPEGTFDIVIPDGVQVADMRPGAAPAELPGWLAEEVANEIVADTSFHDARHALAAGRYEEAAELFAKVVELQPPGRNWAWFWLGKAHYELGEYDKAIYELSKVIDIFAEHKLVLHYCHLARGLAYAAKGMKNMAQRDCDIALPVMIDALRNVQGAHMFDYADDPLYRSLPKEDRPTAQQSLAMMINRLRITTGQNFGYDPNASAEDNEPAIAAWEEWLETSGRINFTPDANLVPIPA
jgi:outer membrane lipoprotein-sorting protein